MAAVGGMGKDNSVQESDDLQQKTLSTVNEMCKRNGINHGCLCTEKSCKSAESKRAKVVKVVRINGVSSKILTTLRSATEKRSLPPDSPKRKRRSSRSDKQDGFESPGIKKDDCVLNNNNNISESTVLVNGAHKTMGGVRYTNSSSPTVTTPIMGTALHCSGLTNGNCLSLILPDSTRVCTPPSSGSISSITLDGVILENHKNGTTRNTFFSSNTTSKTSKSSSNNSPPKSSAASSTSSSCASSTVGSACRWAKCSEELGSTSLIDHIKAAHVEPQQEGETFRCLWHGCKVYDKPSCSLLWLERHILAHSGDKPFRCIVDGCGLRFSSQGGLERHVNSHFNTYQPPLATAKSASEKNTYSRSNSKDTADTPTKLLKKRKLKRKRPWLKKAEDFFDSRVMESLRHQLVRLNEQTKIDVQSPTNSITFHSTVIARRTTESGKVQLLLTWTPPQLLPDSWVYESQAASMRTQVLSLSRLPQTVAENIHTTTAQPPAYRKHRRK